MDSTNKIRVAINGFGRIGRAAFKIALTKPELEVVGINDITDSETLAHLLKYDSVYGRYHKPINHNESSVTVDGVNYPVSAIKEPEQLPWKNLNVDVVLECTGRLTKDNAAAAHLKAGAKRVIVSAPTKGGGTQTYLLGVNIQDYK